MAEHKAKHHTVHHEEHATNASESKGPKISNALFGVIAILAIFVLVWFAIKDVDRNNQNILLNNNDNTVGQASEVLSTDQLSQIQTQDLQNRPICKIIVGQTTLYDATTLAASLQADVSTYYSGNTITAKIINANGCVIDVGGNVEFLAVGQVQRVGNVYVTVKDVVMP